MKRYFLIAILVACSSDGAPPIDDALTNPPREAGEAVECLEGTYGGDPTMQCIATWSCRTYGALTLACGAIGDAGIQCVCLREDTPAVTVSATPTSCTDPTAIVTFARERCGWSWL